MTTRFAALTCASLVLLLSACGAPNADGELTITDRIDGQDVRVDLPTAGDPAGVAVWFHGQGGDVNTRMNEEWLNALREEGWAVASSDFGGNHWGNPESVEAATTLTEWAEQQAGVDTKLYVAGSMGGLASLNAITGGEDIACWYGTMPVLTQQAVENVPDAQEQIDDAWEGEVPPLGIPAENLSQLPASTKYRVLASPADTWVPKSHHGDLLADVPGLSVSVLEVSGEHGDPSHFDAADLARFAAGC